MDHLLGLLCSFVLILAFITLVGHGIWLLLAAMWRALMGSGPPGSDQSVPCPRCGSRIWPEEDRCSRCLLHRESPVAEELRELEAAARQIQRFLEQGSLDRETCDRMYQCIEARQRSLMDRKPAAPPPLSTPKPVPVAPREEEEILDVLPVGPAPVPVLALAKENPAPLLVTTEVVDPPPPPPPPQPRRSLGQVLAAFMEERNILWGELVGGLLIVGCSIALVISLWQTLEQIPYFPFLIFALVTASLFGAGLYTLHRWKLQTTSQGLLVIATLLVPLNFLVLAGLSKGKAGGFLEIGIEVISCAVFTYLTSRAARVVADPELLPGVRQGVWLLTLAVVGTGGSQLLVPRWVDLHEPAPALFYLVAGLPIICYGASLGIVLYGSSRHGPLQDRQTNALFAFLGLATFALAVAIGFLIYWSDAPGLVLHRLSVLIALASVPALVLGMMAHRGEGLSPPVRTGGVAVTLTSVTLMLIALELAWPQPLALIGVGAVNFIVLTVLALRCRFPLAHVLALPCLALGYLTAFHLLAGNLNLPLNDLSLRLVQLAFSAQSGAALTVLVVLLATVSELFLRRGRVADGIYYAASSGVGALLCLILVSLEAVIEPDRAALVFGVIGLGCLALNVRWRWQQLTLVGTTLILICFLLFVWHWQPDSLSLRWRQLVVLMVHAILFLAASAWLQALRRLLPSSLPLTLPFVTPFRWAALISTLLALPLLLFVIEPRADVILGMWVVVGLMALVWLAIALLERWPVLFSAFQVAASATVVLFLTAALLAYGRVSHWPEYLLWPQNQHVYGIGLAFLSLLWAILRLYFQANPEAQAYWEPPWPSVDRVMLAVLVGAQFHLAVLGLLPNVINEFVPSRLPDILNDWVPEVFGPRAWLLLGALGTVLAVSLGGRRAGDAVVGLTFLALTVPFLIAGLFQSQLASATALRWAMAIGFLAMSIPIWFRHRLRGLANPDLAPESVQDSATVSRQMLLAGMVAPVLLLTVIVASMRLSGIRPHGPVDGSFFREIGFLSRNLVPLGLISATLVGHALRERSAGYAFAAGLIANLSAMGGYAISVVRAGGQMGPAEWVCLLQIGACVAAAWAIAWFWVRHFDPDLGLRVADQAGWQLRRLQVGIGNALLWTILLVAVFLLIGPFPGIDPQSTTAHYDSAPAWTREAGSMRSWLALALAVTASALYSLSRNRNALSADVVGLGAAGLIALTACSVERLFPGWGYRTLMVGLALIGLVQALLLGRRQISEESSRSLESRSREVSLICLVAIPALALALKAALGHRDLLWASGASALVAGTGAALAWHRRQESWAFFAGLCFNFALSLVVWNIHQPAPLADWWMDLLHANLITTAAGAILWLAARQQIYDKPELTLADSPLLQIQIVLGLLGSAGLLLVALGWVLVRPGGPTAAYVLEVSQIGGWLALLLATAASLWYVRVVSARRVIHLAGVCGVLLVILLACFAGRWDRGGWLSYHVLTVAWSLLGLILLAAGWIGDKLPRLGPAFWSDERRARCAELLGEFFPARSARIWVLALGALVVGLAMRGAWGDPARPYWSSAATLGVSAMAGAMAIWSRRPGYVYLSGFLFNVVGILAWQAWLVDKIGIVTWLAWGPDILNNFIAVNVLCLALASAFWSGMEVGLRRRTIPIDLRGQFLPFTQVSAFLAVQLLAVLILGGIASDLTLTEIHASSSLTWLALTITMVAVALGLWDEQVRSWAWPGMQLYEVGLLAIGLALHSASLEPRWLCWSAGLALGSYVMLASGIVWTLPRFLPPLEQSSVRPGPWYAPLQGVITLLVVFLSAWMSLQFDLLSHRLAGPLAVALVLLAAILAADRLSSSFSILNVQFTHSLVLLLGVLLAAELGWAFLDPTLPAPWLHRNVVLMVALALLAVAYGLGLDHLLNRQSDWARSARQIGPPLGAAAVAILAIVLVQEFFLYDPRPEMRTTPMAGWAVAIVTFALVILIGGAIGLALIPGRDPFQLSERGRTLYVYAAEVLLVLMMVHLRLNVPDLIPPFFGKNWPLVIMAIAFLGVGLGYLFERWGSRVLADPLRRTGVFLPLLPVLAYLVRPLAELRDTLGQGVTGLQPLLKYLGPDRLPDHYLMHATVWFLLGGLYTLVAVTRRSSRFAILAALAANFGLWVFLANQDGLGFLAHPQFWLVPLALILLAAEHFHRERLTALQSDGLRYMALLMLYLSSTADMFIVGLGNSVIWPVVLAVLAIAGVLLGIVLRVRAFLYLGVAFLFLVIFAQIWHAAVDRQQTWVWWASGIVLGAAILTLFAIFEKRRNDVLRLVEEIKKWD